MAVLLLFFILNIFTALHSKKKVLFDSFIFAVLIFCFIVTVSNELLSTIHAINRISIIILWFVLTLILTVYNIKKKNFQFFNNLHLIKEKISYLSTITRITLFSVIVIFIILFIQGIIYPPNNWDSLAYHMPRITEWIAHGSFENFQTHILRQLYQPCFSEYVMMQLQILTGSDLINNSAQLFFHLFSSLVVVAICKEIGLSKKQQLFSFVLTFLLPESLLQASSTQNDIFHGYFILATIYFTIKIFKENKAKNYIFLGISVGLALLSKAIAYLYLPITGLIIAAYILYKTIKNKEFTHFKNALYTLIVIVIINFPHSYRNFQFSHDIMGTSKEESKDYINEEITVSNTISIAIKNIGLHLDPLFIGNAGNVVIEKIHLLTGLDINKKGTNVFGSKFTCNPGWKNHEDTQPNFLHLLLFISSFGIVIWLFFKRNKTLKTKTLFFLSIHTVLQFLLFCAMLSWEPWNTRLHIPLFYASIPVIVIGFEYKNISKIYTGLTFIVIAQAFYIILTNYSREFIHINKQNSEIGIHANRYEKYFTNRPHLFPEYNQITNYISNHKLEKIGLIIHNDTWEYPLYTKLDEFHVQPIHIEVSNYTTSIHKEKTDPECIVSDTKNKKFIKHNHQKYFNISTKNQFIWLYIPVKK